MHELNQNFLRGRGHPAVYHYSRRHASDAVVRLLGDDPKVIGIAITQSAECVVTLSMAASNVITVIELPSHSTLLPKDDAFQKLLSGKAGQPILAGFSMPRVALHLQGALALHVRGADLSTVLAKSTKEPMYPSQVFGKKGFKCIDNFGIDSVWHESGRDAEIEEEFKLCSRAWLSVM